MAQRIIVTSEEEVLHKKARQIEKIDDRILELLRDMADTLHATSDGVGLAAPQVGVLRRAVVIDLGDGVINLINPEIVAKEGSKQGIESCLSVPNIVGTVERPEKVTVRFKDESGVLKEIKGEGLMAVCLCHEIDHLDGIIFTDKAIEIQHVGE